MYNAETLSICSVRCQALRNIIEKVIDITGEQKSNLVKLMFLNTGKINITNHNFYGAAQATNCLSKLLLLNRTKNKHCLWIYICIRIFSHLLK